MSRSATHCDTQLEHDVSIDLNSGLMSYWQFDESSSPRADATGHGHEITVNSPANDGVEVAGKLGNGLGNLTASNAGATYTQYDQSDSLLSRTVWTLSLWYLPGSLNAFTMKNSGGGLANYGTGGPSLTLQNVLVPVFRYGTNPTLGVWNFACFRWNGTTQTISIRLNDGPWQTATVAFDWVPSTAANTMTITPRSSPIDEMGWWDRLLSVDEVNALYAAGNALPYPFTDPSSFAAAGTSLAAATGRAKAESAGTASGSSTASGVAPTISEAAFFAAGTSLAAGTGRAKAEAAGTAAGSATASGVSPIIAEATGTAAGSATAVGVATVFTVTTLQDGTTIRRATIDWSVCDQARILLFGQDETHYIDHINPVPGKWLHLIITIEVEDGAAVEWGGVYVDWGEAGEPQMPMDGFAIDLEFYAVSTTRILGRAWFK